MPSSLDENDPTFEARLDDWVSQAGTDAMPRLMRAQYYYEIAWDRRGEKFASETSTSSLDYFDKYQRLALDEINAAIKLDNSNPYSYYLRQDILYGYGVSRALAPAFSEAIAKYPGYYQLYDVVLSTLEPKWGGSIETMYMFVDTYAGPAPAKSPLKLLYLDLYEELLEFAAGNCAGSTQQSQCVTASMNNIVRPDLLGKVDAALDLYDSSDEFQFSAVAGESVRQMLDMPGVGAYSEAMLQLMAKHTHSDLQLAGEKPTHNSFIADKLAARSWYWKGGYDFAVLEAKQALLDVDASKSGSEEDKDLARAGIYTELENIYERTNRIPEMIAAETAALASGGPNGKESALCIGYEFLSLFEEAIPACDTAIDTHPADMTSRFWRGMSYKGMDKKDDALRDLVVVVDAKRDLWDTAAINMAMIYVDRKDMHGVLDLLRKYPSLFDPAKATELNIALAFYMRCYAHMEQGDLQTALDDCRDSLRHGNVPDASVKEQQLVKRLGLDKPVQ